jgi:hypothetical protein
MKWKIYFLFAMAAGSGCETLQTMTPEQATTVQETTGKVAHTIATAVPATNPFAGMIEYGAYALSGLVLTWLGYKGTKKVKDKMKDSEPGKFFG